MTIKNCLLSTCALLAMSAPILLFAQATPGLLLNDSRLMLLQTTPGDPVISYGQHTTDYGPEFIAEVHLKGFLFCNEFASNTNTANTKLHVRPVHDGWVFGGFDAGMPGDWVQESFARVSDFRYGDSTFVVTACDADGHGPGCVDGGEGAALQCYTANADGTHIADSAHSWNRIFLGTFEGKYADQNNTWVRISDVHFPQSADPGDKFTYTVTYHVPAEAALAPQTSGLTAGSLHSTHYVLKQGWDQSLFTECMPRNIVVPRNNDQLWPGTYSFTAHCTMKNPGSIQSSAAPVVAAALFVGPEAPDEQRYDDNVAFGPSPAMGGGPSVNVQMFADPTSGSSVQIGDQIAYTLQAKVTGTALTAPLQLTDTIGANLANIWLMQTGAFSCTPTSGLICTLPSGTPRGIYSIQYTADVQHVAGTQITNQVKVTGDGGDANAAGVTRQTVHTLPAVNLSVTIDDGQAAYTPGATLDYAVEVSNAGPDALQNGLVTTSFPAKFTPTSWTCMPSSGTAGAGASCASAGGSGNISGVGVTVPAGKAVLFSLKGAIDPSMTGNLVTSVNVAVPSGVTNNGGSSASDENTQGAPVADLSIEMTDGTTTYNPSDVLNYTIIVHNHGPSNISGATVTDIIPASMIDINSVTWGCTPFGSAACTATGNGDINDVIDIPVGAKVIYSLGGTVLASATGDLVNTASVAVPTTATDPVTSNNSATDTNTQGSGSASVRAASAAVLAQGTGAGGGPDAVYVDAEYSVAAQ